jgi:hypothetical protein
MKKQELLREFEGAVSELHRMKSAQVLAVWRGEDRLFHEQIAAAVDRKDQAKQAIIAHQQTHGC